MKTSHQHVLVVGVLFTAVSLSCADGPVDNLPTPSPPITSASPPGPVPATVNLGGTVHESAPTEDRVVEGATVVVTDAAGTITRVTTDNAGHFTIDAAKGTAIVRVAAPRYDPEERSVEIVDGATASFALVRRVTM